ncbi:MAG: tRNA glutamyl-Q(34) synthetase GluQRS [Paracoccaceae bacterium]
MITRFAPSPTGPLHLGHAYSAMLAHDMARDAGGTFLLRIEDIDQSRARPEWEALIFEDLHWLGLDWPIPVMRQSDRLPAYAKALRRLTEMGLTYPCTCSRADIRAALAAPQEGAPLPGPDGLVYPGTCRGRAAVAGTAAIRLDMARAIDAAQGDKLSFTETGERHRGIHSLGPVNLMERVGDIVLARPGLGTSYHLAVTVDDAAQGITKVIRGEDLFEATQIHVVLQALLELSTPTYCHHKLIRDQSGKRLAKRDDARAIRKYHEDGATPADIRRMVGL